jgi:hypothetical protein
MRPILNLLKATMVYYFIEGEYDKKPYNYQDQESMGKLYTEFKTYYEKETNKYKSDIIKIFSYYIADKDVINLFRLFLELVDKVILLNEVAKVYSHPPYNYDSSKFETLSNLVKALSFDNFKVGEFPFPYSSTILFDNIIQIYDWFIELYKNITSENFDKIRYIDTSKCVFIGLYVYVGGDSEEVKINLPLIDFVNILRIVFGQPFLRVTMLIEQYLSQLLNKYNSDSNVNISVTGYKKEMEKRKDRYINIQTDTNLQRDFRLRKPIKQILDNINAYLNSKYKNYLHVNDDKYNNLNITITAEDAKKAIKESREQMNEKIIEFNKNVTRISYPDECIVFIKMLIFLISSTNNVNICTSSIEILFSNLFEFFASSNIAENLKRKIYEYLNLVNDIFIFNDPAKGETDIVDKRKKIKAIFKGLGLSLFEQVHWKTQKSHKTIPNLVNKVKSLDGIIKTCNDEDLKTIFNKFKDNLAYTNVTKDDKDNLKELSEYVNIQQNIMCQDPSSNIESDKKTGITDEIKKVNVILDYINRYTSPGQYKDVDVGKGGGKKHRKRYIKNKQNNNKNDNITMKKQRRNRKRAPVMKTIRNKKEQEQE